MNAELPPWFYVAITTVKLVAPIKKPGITPDAAPDVRPLGVGECLRRAIHSALVTQYKPVIGEHLWPQQIAIGIPGGMSRLFFGVRFVLEVHPEWVLVRIDLRNAHNELKRRAMLEPLAAEH